VERALLTGREERDKELASALDEVEEMEVMDEVRREGRKE